MTEAYRETGNHIEDGWTAWQEAGLLWKGNPLGLVQGELSEPRRVRARLLNSIRTVRLNVRATLITRDGVLHTLAVPERRQAGLVITSILPNRNLVRTI